MKLFDTHAHISLIHDDPIEQLLTIQEARQHNVVAIVNISSNIKLFKQSYEQLKDAVSVFFSIGMAPSEVTKLPLQWEIEMEDLAKSERIVAVGETGLDYFRKFGSKDAQVELFVQQLELAQRAELPVIIHNRDAGGDVLDILKKKIPSRGAVFHCYSENWEYAQKSLDLGLNIYFSFAGSVTYRNARHLHEAAQNIPLEHMLIESESPFIVPAQYHGKRNKPMYITKTLHTIANLRSMPEEELAEKLFENSCRFFNLDL